MPLVASTHPPRRFALPSTGAGRVSLGRPARGRAGRRHVRHRRLPDVRARPAPAGGRRGRTDGRVRGGSGGGGAPRAAAPGSPARCCPSRRRTRRRAPTASRRCRRRSRSPPAATVTRDGRRLGRGRALGAPGRRPRERAAAAQARLRGQVDLRRRAARSRRGRPRRDDPEAMYALGWTDGLPTIAPTPERVAAMLAGRDPGVSLGHVPARAWARRRSSGWRRAPCWPAAGPSTSPSSRPWPRRCSRPGSTCTARR